MKDMNVSEDKEITYTQDETNEAINFTDLNITVKELNKSYIYFKDDIGHTPLTDTSISKKQKNIVKKLMQSILERYHINKNKGKKDFLVTYYGHYFRCFALESITGDIICCRHMPFNFMTLDDLKYPENIIPQVLHSRFNRGGLLFICGQLGNGKTTTCSAIVKRRLETFGGICITVEDPPEIPLHGIHGRGLCIQTEAEKDKFSESVRASLRGYPTNKNTMLFLGEIRDGDTAIQALKSSIDGRLVIASIHSDSVINGLSRLLTLAKEKVSEDEAHYLLSEAFRMGIHQQLMKSSPRVSCLLDTNNVYNNIKNKTLHSIASEIEHQSRALKNNDKIAYKER